MSTDRLHRLERFYTFVTNWPRTILVLALALISIPASYLLTITRDSRIEVFVPSDHPSMLARADVKRVFNLGDPIAIAIVTDEPGGVFNPHGLQLVAWLTEKVRTVPGVDPNRITSLATVRNIVGTSEGMTVERFFETPPSEQQGVDRVRRAVMDLDVLQGRLIARNGQATVVLAEPVSEAAAEDVYHRVAAMVKEAPVKGERLFVAGGGAVTAQMGAYIDADTRRLNPFSTILIIIITFLAFRTLTGVLLPQLLIGSALIAGLGCMAAAGIPLNVITNILPVVLIVTAVSEGIHIMGEFYEQKVAHPDLPRRELVVRTMSTMWRPVTVTSLNDVVGFTAIYLASWMPPLKTLALFASIGRIVQAFTALIVLPAALTLISARQSRLFALRQGRRHSADSVAAAMSALGRWVSSKPLVVLSGAGVLLVMGAAGVFRVEVNDSRIDNFHASEPIHQADTVINRLMNGTNFLDVFIDSGGQEGLFSSDNLRRIESLQSFLALQPHVKGTISVVDYVKQMNMAMNQNRRDAHKIPDDDNLIAQYFLLYASGGDSRDLEEMIDFDYRRANLRVTLDTGLYSERKVVVEAAEKYLDEHFNRLGLSAKLAGSVFVDYHWVSQVGRFSIVSTLLSALAIWAFAAISFRSMVAGLFVMLPVLIAECLIFAAMGYSGVWLGVGTSMFSAIAIAVGVDFAVHVVNRLIVLSREQGKPLPIALEQLFPSTGRAVFFSFLSVLLGFGLLATSQVPSLVWFGSLVAVAVFASFVFSITVLPALAQVMKPAFLKPRL